MAKGSDGKRRRSSQASRGSVAPEVRSELLVSSACGDLERVVACVERHACPVHAADPINRRTALHLAASEGHSDVVSYLLSKEASPNIPDRAYQRTALHLAAIAKCGERMVEYEDIVAMILDVGGVAHVVDVPYHRTPLHFAAIHGSDTLVMLLLHKSRAAINNTDREGRTALHLAAARGDPDVVQVLLDNDAVATIRDEDGLTAEELAQSEEIRELLANHNPLPPE